MAWDVKAKSRSLLPLGIAMFWPERAVLICCAGFGMALPIVWPSLYLPVHALLPTSTQLSPPCPALHLCPQEFDSPDTLLKLPWSMFNKLVDDTGPHASAALRKMAADGPQDVEGGDGGLKTMVEGVHLKTDAVKPQK